MFVDFSAIFFTFFDEKVEKNGEKEGVESNMGPGKPDFKYTQIGEQIAGPWKNTVKCGIALNPSVLNGNFTVYPN